MDQSNTSSTTASSTFDEEWEEWDGSTPFWHHCVAGSIAGLAEHTLVYPLDTVRTHIQVCAACNVDPVKPNAMASSTAPPRTLPSSTTSMPRSTLRAKAPNATVGATLHPQSTPGMWQTMRHLMSEPISVTTVTPTTTSLGRAAKESAKTAATEVAGVARLWRGVQTMLVGCIPAHALYFSTYELVKAATTDSKTNEVTAWGGALAGGAAVVSHDMIMVPLDTIKQRLQLGHYRGVTHAMRTMIVNEGAVSLYRSFPVTLAANIPYGMVMVGTNEYLKRQWSQGGELTLATTLGASAVAGLTAAATTTPLDRIKTYLQTQQLTPACSMSSVPPESCPLKERAAINGKVVVIRNWKQAALRIYTNEGAVGFFRGMLPRVLSHTPAVAISWTSYETAKKYLKLLDSN